jgi:hypothetical protein
MVMPRFASSLRVLGARSSLTVTPVWGEQAESKSLASLGGGYTVRTRVQGVTAFRVPANFPTNAAELMQPRNHSSLRFAFTCDFPRSRSSLRCCP